MASMIPKIDHQTRTPWIYTSLRKRQLIPTEVDSNPEQKSAIYQMITDAQTKLDTSDPERIVEEIRPQLVLLRPLSVSRHVAVPATRSRQFEDIFTSFLGKYRQDHPEKEPHLRLSK